MDTEQPHQARDNPVWEESKHGPSPDPELCQQGDHTWVAAFFESGRLAYWECAGCGNRDREIEESRERLEWISGWIECPPRLLARGATPPTSTRKWTTPDGAILAEGDPSSTHHVGLRIPEMPEAHTYILMDKDGEIIEVYAPERERLGEYSDHYWLIRYQVIGDKLVRLTSHCFEESTLDVPFTDKPKQETVLSDLELLSG